MSISAAMQDAACAGAAARGSGAREALAVVVLLYGLTQSAEALGGDPYANVVKDIQPIVGGTPLPVDFMPRKSLASEPQFSASEFQPRKTRIPDAQAPAGGEFSYQAQPPRSTSGWQRLADYRSQGRVRLLTLWQSPTSSVSLQTGRHGGPSLQWSRRVLDRGGATRGLLDQFMASSLGATRLGAKLVSHGTNGAPANNKPP